MRQIFKTATSVAPNQAYLFQQWAIFQSTHPSGDFLEAEFYAETAAWMQPKNSSFIHTQAEVATKRATSETSHVLKEQLRRKARAFLEQMPKTDRFRTSTRCKLLVDEVADLSEELVEDERSLQDQYFSEKLNDAELAISRAQQEFPDDAEMFEIKSRLWDGLKEKAKALKALERAWAKSPRGTGTAVRLGKMYAAAGRVDDKLKVLREALEKARRIKPRIMHWRFIILRTRPQTFPLPRRTSLDVRRSTFATFESEIYVSTDSFREREYSKGGRALNEINSKAPKSFRTRAPRENNVITAALPLYSGTVDSTHDQYALIRSGAYPAPIFAPRESFSEDDIGELAVGIETEFRLRFSRRGPAAVNITIRHFT